MVDKARTVTRISTIHWLTKIKPKDLFCILLMWNGKKEKQYLTAGEASLFTGIGIQTLRKMADEKTVLCYKTPTGQRRFDKTSLQKLCNASVHDEDNQVQKQNFLYTRVSSKKQVDDLSRQIEYVRRPEYADYVLIQDVGSGINFKRKGIQTILDACVQGTIGEVVVAHKDRLSRFGYDLIEMLVTKAGGKITLLGADENKSSEQELADDLLSIVHIFSCRQMGKRKYKRSEKDKVQDTCCEVVPDETTEEVV
jgi:putative resolvase